MPQSTLHMTLYKYSVQIFFLSFVIAGLWLWEVAIPVKLICFGLLGMVVVITQEELPGFVDRTLANLSAIDIRLRVIERSLELHRIEPDNTEPASTAISEELERQVRVGGLLEKVSPAAIYDLFALIALFVLSSGLAWLWVIVLADRVF